ncbi:MAG: TfoX/Sxy family protein [Eubacterium sp.]|nr:TfoX/Sxy family protein [Eubacterium sp.]
MTDLTSMRNIGKELERKLKLAGINSAEELITIGSKEAYFKLKLRFPEVCSVHLYALQGAIDNTDFNMLSEEVKKDLKAYADELK